MSELVSGVGAPTENNSPNRLDLVEKHVLLPDLISPVQLESFRWAIFVFGYSAEALSFGETVSIHA